MRKNINMQDLLFSADEKVLQYVIYSYVDYILLNGKIASTDKKVTKYN